MKQQRCDARLRGATSPVVETLEGRRLMTSGPAIGTDAAVLVFNSAKGGTPGGGPSHTDVLTITDTGGAPLALASGGVGIVDDPSPPANAVSAPAAFAITNASSLPASLSPGQSAQVDVVYTASRSDVLFQSAALQIHSNDPNQPVTTVQLHGLGTAGQFGYNEPSLVQIMAAYDIPTNIGTTDFANSQYPENPGPSSEVTMPRLVKAGSGPVTITPLASFDVGTQPALRLGYYAPGDPADRTELFTVNQSDAQAVNPAAQGATSFDPGSAPFGLYAAYPGVSTSTGQPDIHCSESGLNAPLDPAHPIKFRFFPLENPDGSIVANAYVVAAEDYNGTAFNSFTNFVGIIRNVQPAPDATAAPVLGLENLDGLPFTNRMMFNRIQAPNPTLGDKVHDTAVLRIHNTGDKPLVISSVTLSDTTNWQVVNPPAAGTAVAANGGTLDLTVRFIAQSAPQVPYNETNDTATIGDNGLPSTQAGGVWNAMLTINGNDPITPSRSVQLAGYWQHLSEHEEEMGLQTLVNLLAGFPTQIAATPMTSYTEGATPTYYGEEVPNAFLWQAADPTQPVTVRDIGTLVSEGNAQAAGHYTPGNSANPTVVLQTDADAGQSVLPTQPNSANPAEGSFTPSGTFGWDAEGVFSQDSLNPQQYGAGHLMRFYPLRDQNGNVIPNAWLICPKIAPTNGFYQNFDFNDNVLVAFNVRPTNFAATPADLQAVAANGSVSLQWQPVSDSSLVGYNVYRSASASGPFTKLNAAPFSQAAFTDPNPGTGTVYYRVTAVDAAGESLATVASLQVSGSTGGGGGGGGTTLTPAQQVAADRLALRAAQQARAQQLHLQQQALLADARAYTAALRALHAARAAARRAHQPPSSVDPSLQAQVNAASATRAADRAKWLMMANSDFTGIAAARHQLKVDLAILRKSRQPK